MITSLNRRPIQGASVIASRYSGKSITVFIDSSKTNTAICVRNRTYKILDIIEFDGSKDKDILELIHEQRKALDIIFAGAKVLEGGIEDIITKKEETSGGKYSQGLQHHHSRYVITAVFVSIICFFQDKFDVTLEPISNQAWKAAVLPKELNRRDVYKGSVEYVRGLYPQYLTGTKDDDTTDAICIGEYMKMKKGYTKGVNIEDIPDEEEFIVNPCKYRLYPETTTVKEEVGVQFEYNESLTLEMNARAIANRIKEGQLGWATLTINQVTIQEIYLLCAGKFKGEVNSLKVIVKRV